MDKWRWPTWALVAWAAVAVAVSAVVVGAASDPNRAGYAVGQLSWVWVIGFAILAIVWRQTRPLKGCPRCGLNLPVSASSCPRCGYYPGLPAGPAAAPGGPFPGYSPQPPAYPGYLPGSPTPEPAAQPDSPAAASPSPTVQDDGRHC
jgi:ribosomal protein L40E